MPGKAPLTCALEQESVPEMEGEGGQHAGGHQRQLDLQEADLRILPRAHREQQDSGGGGEREAGCRDRHEQPDERAPGHRAPQPEQPQVERQDGAV